jgi:hypothetical protein
MPVLFSFNCPGFTSSPLSSRLSDVMTVIIFSAAPFFTNEDCANDCVAVMQTIQSSHNRVVIFFIVNM